MGDGTYKIDSINSPSTELPLIDIMDTGKWITGVLAQPEQCVKDIAWTIVQGYRQDSS